MSGGGVSKANQRQSMRHKAAYEAYRKTNQREKNKARRLAKHLAKFPKDLCAKAAMNGLPAFCRKGVGYDEG